jgi:type II secretory pathway component GspD/PulD (secretin)
MMIRLVWILSLVLIGLSAIAQVTEPAVAAETTISPRITIDAKASDIRDVVHSVFEQAKMDYVMEQYMRGLVYLSVHDLPLERALQALSDAANIQFVLKNGIYMVGPKPKESVVTPAPVTTPVKPVVDYMSKTVTINVTKQPIAEVVKLLATQTGATLELDPNCPSYQVSMCLQSKSLKIALNALSSAAPLSYSSMPDGTIKVRMKTTTIQSSNNITGVELGNGPLLRTCARCHKNADKEWRWCPFCGKFISKPEGTK